MDELDRYQPLDWSKDGVTTVWAEPSRQVSQRRFIKRANEKWLAVAAKVTVLSLAVAVLTPTTTIRLTPSYLVQHAAVPDISQRSASRSQLRDVEAGHWPKLLKFLDRFPRDETVKSYFEVDPIFETTIEHF
jgi:hypothetical protein